VEPRWDQLRRTGGISEMPDSSKKTSQADAAAAPYLCRDGWSMAIPVSIVWGDGCSSCWPCRAGRSRGQGAAPAATRGRQPWRRRRPVQDEPTRQGAISACRPPPCQGGDGSGACGRPALSGCADRPGVRRQDDRWGVPWCAAARSFGVVHTKGVAAGARAGAGRGTSAALWAGHARYRPGYAAAGWARPSGAAKASSPSATRVWRTRRASLRATARVARLPPWRALTCW
jgi:hypothetical protein